MHMQRHLHLRWLSHVRADVQHAGCACAGPLLSRQNTSTAHNFNLAGGPARCACIASRNAVDDHEPLAASWPWVYNMLSARFVSASRISGLTNEKSMFQRSCMLTSGVQAYMTTFDLEADWHWQTFVLSDFWQDTGPRL